MGFVNTNKQLEDMLAQLLSLGGPVWIAAPSGTDAVSAYAGFNTLTVAGGPAFDENNIVVIVQRPAGGKRPVFHTQNRFFSVAGTTITVDNGDFDATDQFTVVFLGTSSAAGSSAAPMTTIEQYPASGDNGYWLAASAATTEKDAIAAYSAATDISITGLGWTFTEDNIVHVIRIPNTGDVEYFQERSEWSVAGTTLTVAGAAFAATDKFIVLLTGKPRAYNRAGDYQKVGINSRYEAADSIQTVQSLTGLVAATTRYMVSLEDYRHHTIHLNSIANVTVKVWYTNDASATDAATTGWVQDLSAGSITTDTILVRHGEKYLAVLFEVISTGAGTLDIHMARYN